jgi:hypothetical protein
MLRAHESALTRPLAEREQAALGVLPRERSARRMGRAQALLLQHLEPCVLERSAPLRGRHEVHGHAHVLGPAVAGRVLLVIIDHAREATAWRQELAHRLQADRRIGQVVEDFHREDGVEVIGRQIDLRKAAPAEARVGEPRGQGARQRDHLRGDVDAQRIDRGRDLRSPADHVAVAAADVEEVMPCADCERLECLASGQTMPAFHARSLAALRQLVEHVANPEQLIGIAESSHGRPKSLETPGEA